MKQCHARQIVSREEREQKKYRLKAHRQWDRYGKIYDNIHAHNRLFEDLLDDTKEVDVTWDDRDIVDMYQNLLTTL